MTSLLILEAVQASKLEPKKIVCRTSDGEKIAMIYADSALSFLPGEIRSVELDAIKVVKDNFFLFWDNLITHQ